MTEHNITLSDLEGLDLEDFDPAEYITSDEAAAAYITQALATNDAAIFAAAVGDIVSVGPPPSSLEHRAAP